MTALLRILTRGARALSDRAAHRWGVAIGWLLGRGVRHRRGLVLRTMAHCLPERTPAERVRLTDAMYRHFGLMVVECLRFSGARAAKFAGRVTIEGREHAEAVKARGRGTLMLMGHIGNWELMGVAASTIWTPLHVVVKPIRNKALNEFWREAREGMGLGLLPREDALRDCLKALRRGEMVALVLDQNMKRSRGIFVDFFGRPACTTPGLAYLSAVSQAAVLPAYMIRGPDGRHRMHMLPPIEPPPDRRDETIRAYTQRYTRILEDIIRAHPDQWTWLHHRWRTQPTFSEDAER